MVPESQSGSLMVRATGVLPVLVTWISYWIGSPTSAVMVSVVKLPDDPSRWSFSTLIPGTGKTLGGGGASTLDCSLISLQLVATGRFCGSPEYRATHW